MTGFAARRQRPSRPSPARHRALGCARAIALAAAMAWTPSFAQAASPAAAAATDAAASKPAPANSGMDAPLFYQLLIGEIELRSGRAANAYEVMLDAARRQGDDALYQRAVEIALQARAGEQALAAVQAWRAAKPRSVAPLRYQTQILLALNRAPEIAEPLTAWLAEVPTMERPGLISGLPRLLQRLPDAKQGLSMASKLLAPYRDAPATRSASRIALGRLSLLAGDSAQAAALARSAAADDPASAGPVLLALDLVQREPAIESLVTGYLGRDDAEPLVRLAYVRLLTQSQRYAEAGQQLEQVTRARPQLPEPWLTLGALRVELKQPQEAETALQRYLALVAKPAVETPAEPAANGGATSAEAASTPNADSDADDDTPEDDNHRSEAATANGQTQAWLLLSQAAEQRGDMAGAEAWLAKVDNPQRALEVQSRRASLLARQGKVKEARALIRAVPERTGDDARAKAMAEAQLLRDVKQWREAGAVLAAANARFADDTELLYEQAMVAEKLDQLPEMERLLRRVIALKPDHPHAHNALGYSLADRGERLPEARDLIRKALDLSPGDPFITDSLGWVEFKLGNRVESIRLLRNAYSARPDTEIAAHLGEVLWADGQRDEAMALWRDARGRDASNEVLRDTLARLKVGL